MGGSRVGLISVGLLATAILPIHGAEKNDSPETPVIGVSLYNYSQIPEDELDLARRTASQIFRQVGIRVAWSDVPVSGESEEGLRQTGRQLGVSDLRLRILSESKVPNWAKNTHQVAFSLLPRNGGFGMIASIYSERLLAIARRENRPAGLALGCVIAHEMGHLLLQMRGHGRDGIMSFPVTGKYLSQASRGRLVFTPAQTNRIQREVRKRWENDQESRRATRVAEVSGVGE